MLTYLKPMNIAYEAQTEMIRQMRNEFGMRRDDKNTFGHFNDLMADKSPPFPYQ